MIKKFLNIFLTIIIVIAIIIVIYSAVQSRVSGEPYTNILGYTLLEVVTGSMSGTIEIGDGVIVKLTDDVAENDIIVYEKNGQLITHRLISKEEGQLITQGDANNTQDESITIDMVVGKVVHKISNLNAWKIGIVLIIVLLVLVSIWGRFFLGHKSFFKKWLKK